ncbi:GTPase [Marixanthomonas ophiurae]|uniref:GTPase n=1 Tax=Marixanthomonas ophiurae TaxID=387659 RepID=A0A3E1QCC6_9FLAO|nr:GTPase [Marixanthomonas ophiurae]RFN59783.1 GTPase [Marixanthomonas ophiurae]
MRLIFVYNANSGKRNAYLDSLHKIMSPSTYTCSLCELTYGFFSEKKEWKLFRKQENIEMDFYHKNEFVKKFKSKWLPKYTFPIILSEKDDRLEVFLSSEKLNELETVEGLVEKIRKGLASR